MSFWLMLLFDVYENEIVMCGAIAARNLPLGTCFDFVPYALSVGGIEGEEEEQGL